MRAVRRTLVLEMDWHESFSAEYRHIGCMKREVADGLCKRAGARGINGRRFKTLQSAARVLLSSLSSKRAAPLPSLPSLNDDICLGLYATSCLETLVHATLPDCIDSRCRNPETPCASLPAPGRPTRHILTTSTQ